MYYIGIQCAARAKPPPCQTCGFEVGFNMGSQIASNPLKLICKLTPKSAPKPLKFGLQGLSWSPLASPWVVLGRLGALLDDFVEIFGEDGPKSDARWAKLAASCAQDGP